MTGDQPAPAASVAKELVTIVKPKKPWSKMTEAEKEAIAAVTVDQINAGRKAATPTPS